MARQLYIPGTWDEHVIVDDAVAEALLPFLQRGWMLRRIQGGKRRPALFKRGAGEGGWPMEIRLARFLTRAKPCFFVEHKNGNVLDCRYSNLYLVQARVPSPKSTP